MLNYLNELVDAGGRSISIRVAVRGLPNYVTANPNLQLPEVSTIS